MKTADGRPRTVAPTLFSGKTAIHWQPGRESDVDLKVFDPAGRVVKRLVRGRLPGTQ